MDIVLESGDSSHACLSKIEIPKFNGSQKVWGLLTISDLSSGEEGAYCHKETSFNILSQFKKNNYLPNAPYVLTSLRGSKLVFMACFLERRFWTTGMLRYAMRTARDRLSRKRMY
jgi:hypothetical protein